MLREVRPGELVPRSAIGAEGDVRVQPLTLRVDANSAAPLLVGSVVDVYVNPVREDGNPTGRDFAGAELALESVSVAGLPQTGGSLAGSQADRAVQVMAPKDRIRDLIGQIDLGARVTLVPVPGSRLRNDT